ncbi:MAG: hypothetical protein ACYC3Q_00205 [Gemmatimonadaceae bacterium]
MSPRRHTLRAVVAACCVLLLPAATTRAQEPQLLSRLDPSSRYAIEVLLDSAARLGLPPEALLSKTLEGISKGVPAPRIVAVVKRYFAALRSARSTLGGNASVDELSASAGALQAGVDPKTIINLRSSRKGSILTPLVVLVDLVSRGVPQDDASSAIIGMSQKGAVDSDFMGLRRGVEQDILGGSPPGAALDRRAREFPGRAPPAGGRLSPPTS